jgi:hypothetical protein
MPFEWIEYLRLAQSLKDRNTNYTEEAGYRSAVSRAYYAAFCHAIYFVSDYFGEKLIEECVYPGQIHGKLEEFFRQRGRRRERWAAMNVADKLKDLREWRKVCDYDKVGPEDFDINYAVENAINYSQEVFDELQPRRW